MTTTVMLVLLWGAVLATLALTLRLTRRLRFVLDPYNTPPPVPFPPVGQPAPPFVADDLDGGPVALADYAERSLTLVFVSDHCASCRTHLPTLGRIQALAQRAGTEITLVAFDDGPGSRPAARRLLEEFDLHTRTVVVPPGHPLHRTYNPNKATPAFCHIDRGVVRATGGLGTSGWADLVGGWQAAAARERPALERLT